MSKLFEDAIAKARGLPEDEQDAMADTLFAHMTGTQVRHRLTDEQVAEVLRIRENLRSGATELVPDEEMEAFWKSRGA